MPRYLAIAAALVLLFTIVVGLIEVGPAPGITIDGNFDDWASQRVPEYPGGTASSNPNVQIAGTSLFVDGMTVFLRVRVMGPQIFGDPTGWDTMYGFLDTDGLNATGYDLGDVGAEYVARVSGSAGLAEDADLLKYDVTGRTRNDWSGFTITSELAAAASGTQVEVSVSAFALEGYSDATLRVRFAFDDNEGETSHTSVPIGAAAGALLLEQVPQTTVLSGGVQPFLNLTFRSLGEVAFVVQQVTIAAQGSMAFTGVPQGLLVGAGSTVTRTVSVDVTGLPQGTLVTAAVAAVQIEPSRPHAIVGVPARAYVGQAPAGRAIDGLFGDWPSPVADADSGPPRRKALNILSRDGNVSGNQMFLYAQLEGVALEGELTPGKPTRPLPSEPGNGTQSAQAGPLPPVVGMDYVRFYVDTDSGNSGGVDVGGLSADHLIEVRGRNGFVNNGSVYRLVGANWVWETSLATGVGDDRIEVGATLVGVAFNGTEFVAVSGDWAGVADRADPMGTRGSAPDGTRSPSDPPIVLDVSGNGPFWFRDATHATETACTHNKVASSTKGSGPAQTLTLNTGESACWYVDATTGQTIPAGDWETLTDLSNTGGADYDVKIEIWNLTTDDVAEAIQACVDQTTFGDDVQCLATSVASKTLTSTQVVRIVFVHSAASGTVSIDYDDSDGTGDSRTTLPIPEFGDVAAAGLAVACAVLHIGFRRRRTTRSR